MEPQLVLALQLSAKHYFTRTQHDIEDKMDAELQASKHRNHYLVKVKSNEHLKYKETKHFLQCEKIAFSMDTVKQLSLPRNLSVNIFKVQKAQ